MNEENNSYLTGLNGSIAECKSKQKSKKKLKRAILNSNKILNQKEDNFVSNMIRKLSKEALQKGNKLQKKKQKLLGNP